MMKASEFIKKLVFLADNCNTLYVKGCFGADLNSPKAKKRYTNNNPFNKKANRVDKINKIDFTCFGFDCVCLIKGLLWNFDFKTADDALYGGALYKSNSVPDFGADDIMNHCINVDSCNNTEPRDGEVLWMDGHVGVYVGAGQVIECTPKWRDNQYHGVQYVNYEHRGWKKHGWLRYIEDDINAVEPIERPYYIVKKGDTLSKIAKANNTTYQKLAKINNIPDPNKIYQGQKIFLQ